MTGPNDSHWCDGDSQVKGKLGNNEGLVKQEERYDHEREREEYTGEREREREE